MKINKDFWITFGLAFLLTLLVQSIFFPAQKEEPKVIEKTFSEGLLTVEPIKKTFHYAETVIIDVKVTGTGVTLPIILNTPCPKQPFEVFRNGKSISAETKYTCPAEQYSIDDKGTKIKYDAWNTDLFGKIGSYEIKVPYEGKIYSTQFNVEDDSWIGGMWNQLFNRPIYNILIFLTSLLSYNLGWGILLLTLILKLILLIPTQRAMEGQRAMQLIQPKLKEIQQKYKGNQQMISLETMRIMKENKVNPLGSCLPILFQIPILVGLFYAVQNGLSLAYSINLYPIFSAIHIEKINPLFLNLLDLSKPEIFVMPFLVGISQYIQMRMALPPVKKTDEPKKKIIEQNGETMNILKDAMPDMSQMSKVMTYTMPILIAFMSISFPAGIAFYWFVQNIFGIGQQYYVNHERLSIKK